MTQNQLFYKLLRRINGAGGRDKIHSTGTDRHGYLWLSLNEHVCNRLRSVGLDPSEEYNRTVVPLVVLCTLDVAKKHYSRHRLDDPLDILRHAAQHLYVQHGVEQSVEQNPEAFTSPLIEILKPPLQRKALPFPIGPFAMNTNIVTFFGPKARTLSDSLAILNRLSTDILKERSADNELQQREKKDQPKAK